MEEAEGSANRQLEQRLRRLTRSKLCPAMLAGAGVTLVLLLIWSLAEPESFAARFESLVASDIDQARLDTALPAPQGDLARRRSSHATMA